jgi:hypothetical protein
MRAVCLCVLLITALAAIGGCNGDSNGGSVLAQGTTTVGSGSDIVLATIDINQPGTLRGTITWSGDPTEMAVAFKHVAPAQVIGLSVGSSPTGSTVAVTSARVAAGTQWQLLAANGSATAVSVQFEATFQADCATCP